MSLIYIRNETGKSVKEIQQFVNISEWQLWFHSNWTMPLYFSFIYAVLVISLKSYMRHRKAFQLRKVLVVWNASLSIFSTTVTLYSLANLLFIYSDSDFWYKNICTREYSTPLTDIFEVIFVWSKVMELGDTIFIVLRKRQLIFLHWYHHVTVLCLCWGLGSAASSVNLWMGKMNFFVHSIMYTYYTLKALQIRIPLSVSFVITSLQLGQMIAGIGVSLFVVFETYLANRSCGTKLEHSYISLIIYSSYLVLFINFFKKAYFGGKTVKTL